MNKTARFLSIAAVAAFASFGAQADEADASQFATKFETSRTRAEVMAEASTVPQTSGAIPVGSRALVYTSTADRNAVNAQAVEALPEKHRDVFLLAFYQELPYNEIAEVLDLPVGTIKSRMFAASQKLRAGFQDLR